LLDSYTGFPCTDLRSISARSIWDRYMESRWYKLRRVEARP